MLRLSFPLLLACFSFVLAGCAGHSLGCSFGLSQQGCAPATTGYQQQQDSDAKAAAAEAAAAAQDEAECRAQGFQPDTAAYEQCRTKFADERATATTNDRASIAGRLLGRSPMNN